MTDEVKSNKRLYLVRNKVSGEESLVEAATPAGAIALKARAEYEAKVASPRDVQDFYTQGQA